MRLIFAGTPQVASQGLEILAQHHEITLVFTAPDAKVGRHGTLTPSPVAQRAETLGIPVIKTRGIGERELGAIAAANAELAVVIAFGSLIREPALSAVPWWNLHFSLLPAWRGASPLQHSILHQSGAGVTVFELDAGMDTGPIIAQRALEVPAASFGEALDEFLEAGLDLLLYALSHMPAKVEQQGEASYAPKLSRNNSRIDFRQSAAEIERAVRAFNPEPMAWAEYSGTPIRLIRARVADSAVDASFGSGVGEIWADRGAVYVRCGDGALELIEVQPAGKRSMSAADWHRGVAGGSFA